MLINISHGPHFLYTSYTLLRKTNTGRQSTIENGNNTRFSLVSAIFSTTPSKSGATKRTSAGFCLHPSFLIPNVLWVADPSTESNPLNCVNLTTHPHSAHFSLCHYLRSMRHIIHQFALITFAQPTDFCCHTSAHILSISRSHPYAHDMMH